MATDLRIPAGLSSAALMPLPKIPTVELCLSGLSDADVSQACEVVQELQPAGGYSDINCKPSSLTEVGCQDLIHGLVKHSVRLGRITILTNVVITNDQKDQLTSLAGTALKCFLLL
nr:uncharacterized protein LOC128703861 isoform X2 [Cherax quadricarinatus]